MAGLKFPCMQDEAWAPYQASVCVQPDGSRQLVPSLAPLLISLLQQQPAALLVLWPVSPLAIPATIHRGLAAAAPLPTQLGLARTLHAAAADVGARAMRACGG